MAAEGSAYAALGLEPGADAEAVERAYKRLIKQFHPDRAGGDARRASEINRAYRELRAAANAREPLDIDQAPATRGAKWRPVHVALIAAAMGALLVFATKPESQAGPSAAEARPVVASKPAADAMDQPLSAGAIEAAVHAAVWVAGARDEVALAEASRDCHRQLRTAPDIAQLDRCAAFDDAVVQLLDRDPLRSGGPFSQLAVTGRQMSGATLLSNDYLRIDSRLARIRLHVELALAPSEPPPVAEPPGPVTADR